ncbi:Pilin (type 1 fimbria component protein) [Dyella sp. OK004]|uniref:fimbrial protein n=1 Tax=Dyella sp. OK004 TaxID=1855292 RepID=UPI0008F0CD06|nr:fimbrial protein [Dyella sp. OK004]SFR95150.1 Pilin (type 1 fimbria component protein) [Dyella sp. OK004]
MKNENCRPRIFKITVLAILFMVANGQTFATCIASSTVAVTFNIPKIVASVGTKIGDELARQTLPYNPTNVICVGNEGVARIYHRAVTYTSYSNLNLGSTLGLALNTNVSGVGMILSLSSAAGQIGQPFTAPPYPIDRGWTFWGPINKPTLYAVNYTVVFYKTADPVASGTVNGGQIGQTGNLLNFGTLSPVALYLGPVEIVGPDPTCSISAGDVNKTVTLNSAKISDFINSVSAADKPFTITVDNCINNAVAATFTFTGAPDPVNPVIFRNTAGATGVGVRLFSNDGQTIGANGTTNARTIPIVGGRGVLPLTAQYYKTGASVDAGKVSAQATVAMSYN